MKHIIATLLLICSIINIGCGSEDSSSGEWGLEEPQIISQEEVFPLTQYNSFDSETLSVDDKLVFNSKYENENINLQITSTCNNTIHKFSMTLKTETTFKEIIPYQLYSEEKRGEDWNCIFSFEAKNKSGDIHQFSSNKLKFASGELFRKIKSLEIKKTDINGKPAGVKKMDVLFVDQLVINPVDEEGGYSLVCNNFMKKLGKLTNLSDQLSDPLWENPVNKCFVIFVNKQKIHQSIDFIFKRKVINSELSFSKPEAHKIINYGVTNEGFSLKVKNISKQEIKIAFDKKTLNSRITLQYPLIRKYTKRLQIWRSQQTITLEPRVFVNNKKIREKKGLYVVAIKPGKELEVSIKYKLDSQEQLLNDKKILCYTAANYNLTGYVLSFPSKLMVYQIHQDHLAQEKLLSLYNLIHKEELPIFNKEKRQKYIKKAIGCSKNNLKELERALKWAGR